MDKRTYLFKMINECKMATGYDDLISFFNWTSSKTVSSKCFSNLYLDIIDNDEKKSYVLAEIGTTKYNTVLPELTKIVDNKIVAITPFKEILDLGSNIEIYNGNLNLLDGLSYIRYNTSYDFKNAPNCCYLFNNNIDTILYSYYFVDEDIKPYVNLINSDKTIVIGSYGAINDKNKNIKKNEIYSLYNSFKNLCSKNRYIRYEQKEENDSYAVALKVYSKN